MTIREILLFEATGVGNKKCDVKKKGKKFFVFEKGTNNILPNTKPEGYNSIRNAANHMFIATDSNYNKLTFPGKQKKVDNFLKKWEKEKGKESKKSKKKYGFEERIVGEN